MIRICVVGCGYWGPNLIRNFVSCPDTELIWACDKDKNRLQKVMRPYPGVNLTTDISEFLKDDSLDAVAIATPVHTHFSIAEACLEGGKHVLIEKPLASTAVEGEQLLKIASDKKLQLMCDHTFCYTGAVHKMKEIVDSGEIGELLYFDSVRINLGLFQGDINVIWDLAPHDLSILDYIIEKKPVWVSSHGVCHAGNDLENIAYLTMGYDNSFIAHLHLNWLSPVKIRKTIIGGDKKMIVWNDLEPAEKIKVYDKGIVMTQKEHDKRHNLMISYRSGDMFAPQIDYTEALSLVAKEFAACIEEDRSALTDGKAGLRILKILEASEKSIKDSGVNIQL